MLLGRRVRITLLSFLVVFLLFQFSLLKQESFVIICRTTSKLNILVDGTQWSILFYTVNTLPPQKAHIHLVVLSLSARLHLNMEE